MSADVHRAHPNLWVAIMGYAALFFALGLNFVFLQPTFLIFSAPNDLWGAIFLALSAALVGTMKFGRTRALHVVMWLAVGYLSVMAVGTTQPFLDGVGSLQLPIMYVAFTVILVPLAVEPFVNPATGKPPRGETS